MNKREQTIFIRGIAVGMRAVQEFETDLEPVKKIGKKKGRPFGSKNKKEKNTERYEIMKKAWAKRKAAKTAEEDGLADLGQDKGEQEDN